MRLVMLHFLQKRLTQTIRQSTDAEAFNNNTVIHAQNMRNDLRGHPRCQVLTKTPSDPSG